MAVDVEATLFRWDAEAAQQLCAVDDMRKSAAVQAVLGCPLTSSMSGFFLEFPPGNVPLRHRHSVDEMVVVLGGELEMDIDGHKLRVAKHGGAVIPAWTWHAPRSAGKEALLMVAFLPGALVKHQFADELDGVPSSEFITPG